VPRDLPLDQLLVLPEFERASLAARWLSASHSPIAGVIGHDDTLQWQTWLLPNEAGLTGFADFVAWAMSFDTLFGIEPMHRAGSLRSLPDDPQDWLDVDRGLAVQWTPGRWARDVAAMPGRVGEWVDQAGLLYSYAMPSDQRPGMATVVLLEWGHRLGLPNSDLGKTVFRLNAGLMPWGCCLAVDDRHNLRLLAALAPETASEDFQRLPALVASVLAVFQAKAEATEDLVNQVLAAGWTPDVLFIR